MSSKPLHHIYGTMETMKFDFRRKTFYEYLEWLKKQNVSIEDLLFDFTAYVGHMSLNRMITIYELYKKTLGLAGHIADVGVYKGASSLLFAKLVKIFESEALTLVHGFDWFEGSIKTCDNDGDLIQEDGYKANYDSVVELISKQFPHSGENILHVHKMNLVTDCADFFRKYPHLKWKLVMMDAGYYEPMKAAIPYFWERLIPGGIMIFDQYSHEAGPGETVAVNEILPNAVVRTIPNSWMPNAYVIKE